MNQYFQELGFLLNIEPDSKNTKELRRLEDIAEDVKQIRYKSLSIMGKLMLQMFETIVMSWMLLKLIMRKRL